MRAASGRPCNTWSVDYCDREYESSVMRGWATTADGELSSAFRVKHVRAVSVNVVCARGFG